MTVELAKQNGYEAAFRELIKRRNDEPSWLRRAREDAFAHFERIGFPTVRDEDWKYTNVAPITRTKFEPVFGTTNVAASLNGHAKDFLLPEAIDSQLVFVNGVFQRELSSLNLPDGVVISDIAESLRQTQHESRLREQLTANQANGFTALNTALFSSGAFVLVPRGVELTAPVHLLFISQSQNGDAPASFPRVIVIAEENSAATIVESYVGIGAYFTNAVVEVVARAGARIQHYKIQRESNSAFHVANTIATAARGSRYETTNINLGGSLSRHDIAVTFAEEGGECAVDGLYMISAEQHSDTHSVIDHRQPHCTSRQLYKGVLDGKSHAVFNGKVFVRHGAQQTDAQQTNKNLLLSEEARVDTKPQLEIFADDVKCAHGAAVGQLSEDEVFYLESRGINPALARNILTYGFAEEVIERIKIDSIKKQLDEVVLNRLHSGFDI
ncbi:MAG TPA: Fe-S cluster assembly protein SufD [Pyrinomonadaceae bacterium]|jgi:Fe-S cluster assembly protein SufD|nr:Fe-S cluster assembly protein SufD [Pyrinomonadaceae bacterium]